MPSPVPVEYLTRTHKEKRPREYLYEHEVEALIAAAKEGQNSIRNQALVLLCYRHGLRSTEACNLKWAQIDFETRRMHVNRIKGGIDSVHPIRDREIRLLKQLWKERQAKKETSPYVFLTNRGTKFTSGAFQKLMLVLGERSGLLVPMIHPHMLRHSTGYKLANDGVDTRTIQDYLGHANINNTVIYTKLNDRKFERLFNED